jgi:Polyketide cyclase / dehydrase and lipid transport
MATFQNTVTIRREIEDVFAFLADFENVRTWNYAIVETKKTSSGPVAVGTTYRQIRSIPDRSEERFEVTALEPSNRLDVHGNIWAFHHHHQLPAHAYGRRDTPDQCRKPQAFLRCIATAGSPRRLQGQGVGGSQPRHAQAGPGNWTADMTRDEGNYLPLCKRLPSQESLLKYDADAVAMGPRANCWRHYGRERIARFVEGLPCGM